MKHQIDNVILELRGVSKAFGPTRALTNVDFQLRKGEIHALAGENGAGKSTLMNIIDGIHQPDSGEIRINNKAAEYSGIRTLRIKVGVTIFSSTLCGVGGIIYMSKFGAATPQFGVGLELTIIAAAVIGGASLYGGVFRVRVPWQGIEESQFDLKDA